MNTTNLDHSPTYTFKLELYADSQQAVLACLINLLTQFQQEGIQVVLLRPADEPRKLL